MTSEPAETRGLCADPENNRMIINGNIQGFPYAFELFPSLVCPSLHRSRRQVASDGLDKSRPEKKMQKMFVCHGAVKSHIGA